MERLKAPARRKTEWLGRFQISGTKGEPGLYLYLGDDRGKAHFVLKYMRHPKPKKDSDSPATWAKSKTLVGGKPNIYFTAMQVERLIQALQDLKAEAATLGLKGCNGNPLQAYFED